MDGHLGTCKLTGERRADPEKERVAGGKDTDFEGLVSAQLIRECVERRGP